MTDDVVLRTDLPFAEKLCSGKVRDVYRLGDDLLLVATDRISAFDVVMADGIPGKGRVLTALSRFWFEQLREVVPNHFLSADPAQWPEVPEPWRAFLAGRSMRCRRARVLPIEWVVRGYLTGSGLRDYQRDGTVSGVLLPQGLQHASRLEPPILTPSTKAESGHDVPIAFERVVAIVGHDRAAAARDAALALYARARDHAGARGIVIADTKFEFGVDEDGELMLVDECLTPDSSRFWPADEVRPGAHPRSLDKQRLRDWLLAQEDWQQEPPPPPLPADLIADCARTYQDILARLTADTAP